MVPFHNIASQSHLAVEEWMKHSEEYQNFMSDGYKIEGEVP